MLKSSATPQDASSTKAELSPQASLSLPEEPLFVIEPSNSWVAINLRDLWGYRELLYFLMWRDVKVRYKQTALGITWVVMQPLLTTLIFTVFLGMLVRVPSDGLPYPLMAYAGLLPWTFFSGSVSTSSNSLVSSANLITKVYFPRMIIPAAAVGARLVDLGIAFVILAGMMLYYRVSLTLNFFMLPVLVVLVTLLALGFGMLTSALNVKYRDVGMILPVLIQLWMYVSPILYPLSLIPEQWRGLYSINPMVGIVDGFRSILLGRPFNWTALGFSTIITIILLIYSAYMFRRVEKGFADVI
ncbi:MAG: ABC transporter permease [Pyrinomonadaceae bacterium]|nr:ABC transporter permease [Pyrinomonadaceae bacterium]